MERVFLNFYHCPADHTEWEDERSFMCNDRCPVCRREIEPYERRDITKNVTDDGK